MDMLENVLSEKDAFVYKLISERFNVKTNMKDMYSYKDTQIETSMENNSNTLEATLINTSL